MKRKNILKLEALLLTSTLLLTSCASRNKKNNLYHVEQNNNTLEVNNGISRNQLNDYSFIVLYNYDKRITEYYIVSKSLNNGYEGPEYVYYDALTGLAVYREPTEEIIKPTEEVTNGQNIYKMYELPLNYYLSEENYLKDSYSEEEIRMILESLTQYYDNLTSTNTLTLKKD